MPRPTAIADWPRRTKATWTAPSRTATKAIELKPDYADAYNNRGIAKKAKGDLDGAIADYTKAIELKPDDADAYINRGDAKKAKGDLDGAIADYTKAIELKPDDAEAYVNRGDAKKAKGDLDGAIADYTKAIELKPDDAEAYVNRGIAKADQRRLGRRHRGLHQSHRTQTGFCGGLLQPRTGESSERRCEWRPCGQSQSQGVVSGWQADQSQYRGSQPG